MGGNNGASSASIERDDDLEALIDLAGGDLVVNQN
jgi:hypothetical protein